MGLSKTLEPVIRKGFGLSAKSPDASGVRWEPAGYDERWGQLQRMVPLSEEVVSVERERWHQEGRRGRWASECARAIHIVGYNLKYGSTVKKMLWPLRKKRLWAELDNSQEIRWVAWHYAVSGETTHIDGRLVLPSGRELGFDISCIGNDIHWAREAWQQGTSYSDHTESWGCPAAILPTKVLTPALLRTALRAWYVSRYQYRQGHWSNLQSRLPEFIIDDYWESEESSLRAQYKKEAEEAEAEVRGFMNSEESQLLYKQYGQQALLPELELRD